MGNFSFDFIRPYMQQSWLDSLNGRFNGNVKVAAALGWPRFSGEVNARDLMFYGVRYGDANVKLLDFERSGRLKLDANFFNGVLAGITVTGNIGYKREANRNQLNLLVDLPERTDLAIVQPFVQEFMQFRAGYVQGQVNIGGNFDKVILNGELHATQATVFVNYLKTSYTFQADFQVNERGIMTSRPFYLYDENRTGTGKATFALTHRNFDDLYVDFRLDSARNIHCLNTVEGDDDIYYGSAWADGDCHIYGPFNKISMDMHLKSRKNSNIKILYDAIEESERLGYVTFVKRSAPKVNTGAPETESDVIHRINVTVDVNPDLQAEFVIDKKLGDAIKGKGNGVIKMLYDEDENFYMFGTFKATEGDYVFSIPGINLITKKIALQPGGTIIWSGDPYNALLNMTGSFEKKISPAALMTAVSGGSQKNYAPITVQSILLLSGNLMTPTIGFDIQAPDLEKSTGSSGNDVYRVIQRIRQDKDETMKQAVALMLFGNFITPSFAQTPTAGAGVSGTGFAGNRLSSIASSVVNDLFSRAGIPTRIQVNIDDVRSVSGGATRVFVNSEWFLTERVRLDLNYDPTVAMLVNNVALPFNFNLEYMTRNDNWRIKAFSRSSNLLLQQTGTALSTGVSGNTLGAGVVYRRDFDTFRRGRKNSDSASKE